MSFWSDLLRLRRSERDTILGGAIITGLVAGAFLWYSPRYDNPSTHVQNQKTEIVILGRKGTLDLSCDCPPYVIAQRPRGLTFRADIRLIPEQESQPRPAASTPPTSEAPTDISLKAVLNGAGQDNETFIAGAGTLLSKREASEFIHLDVKAPDSDFSGISFVLERYVNNGPMFETPAHVYWNLPARSSFVHLLLPLFYAFLIFIVCLLTMYSVNRQWQLQEQRLEDARANAARNPELASPAWELAGTNLQNYFTRNLTQVRQVFYVSVAVMIVGFAFVLYGVYEQIALTAVDPKHISPPTWVSSISGLITQFIGATFMVIYRSTMAQANEFVGVLDRINTVGIALKVLDQIPDTETDKNSARKDLIALLLKSHDPSVSSVPKNVARSDRKSNTHKVHE